LPPGDSSPAGDKTVGEAAPPPKEDAHQKANDALDKALSPDGH